MRKLLLLAGCLAAFLTASGQQRSVTLTTAGTLSSQIGSSEKYTIASLKVSGPINGSDVLLLRDMIGVKNIHDVTDGILTSLDLSDARFVKGGDHYTYGYGNEKIYIDADDELSRFMFQSCTRLSELKLPRTTKAIGELAFASCENLRTLEIPEGVTKIGRGAFVMAGMDEITLPSSCVEIEDGLFQRMLNLRRVDLGDGLTALPNSTFMYSSVQTVRIGKSLTEFDPIVFYTQPTIRDFECSDANPEYKAQDGVLFSKDGLTLAFYPAARTDDVYTVPAGVRVIGANAFRNATMLFEVNFPETLERIEEAAFSTCTSLETPRLPEGLKYIGFLSFAECENMARFDVPASVELIEGGAFYNTTALEEINVAPASNCYTTRGGALYTKDMKKLVSYPSGIPAGYFSVPTGVEEIAPWAMSGHLSLTSVNLPASVTTVGDYALFACPRLGQIVFGEGIDKLGEGIVFYSDAMTDVYMLGRRIPSRIDVAALENENLIENGTLWVPKGTKSMYENSGLFVAHYSEYDEELDQYFEEDIPVFARISEYDATAVGSVQAAGKADGRQMRFDLSGRRLRDNRAGRQSPIEIVGGRKVLTPRQ